ncbi:MAG: hypothetical protein AAGD43_37190 [Pseudomonadota bacterium]
MSLLCPNCGAPGLSISDSVELGPDAYWDEMTVQRAQCQSCQARFICNYLEKRSFRYDRDDTVNHTAYHSGALSWLLAGIAFQKTRRRVSQSWRRLFARTVLKVCQKRHLPLEVRYEAQHGS